MTNDSLSRSYLRKAQVRLGVLDLLVEQRAYSDVVRDAQDRVGLALKALLRHVGIEPPKWHDVSPILLDHRDRFPGVAGETALPASLFLAGREPPRIIRAFCE